MIYEVNLKFEFYFNRLSLLAKGSTHYIWRNYHPLNQPFFQNKSTCTMAITTITTITVT